VVFSNINDLAKCKVPQQCCSRYQNSGMWHLVTGSNDKQSACPKTLHSSCPTHSVIPCKTWISGIIEPCCNQCPVRYCTAYRRSSGRTRSRGCAVWWYTYWQGMPWAAGQQWSPQQPGWYPGSTGACAGCVRWSAWLLLQAVPTWGTPPQRLPPSTETCRSHMCVS